MNAYVYHWNLRPRPDICVELRIEAQGAIAARREVEAFLRRHRAADWQIETVSRSRGVVPTSPRDAASLPPRV
jgi:hypothetical protein